MKFINLLRSENTPAIPIEFSTVVAINENYLVKLEGTNLLRSSDYGATYPTSINASIVGDVRMVHVFSNGKVLVCGRTKAYYTDFTTIQESTVKNANGTTWIPSLANDNFFSWNGISKQIVGTTEMAVWGCYNNDQNGNVMTSTVAECFYTKDFGANIKVFFRSGQSTANGWTGVINCRHIHQVEQNPNDGTFWIQTGDEPTATMSHWIKATYNVGADTWVLDHIGAGDKYKSSNMRFIGEYIYYGKDKDGGGLCRVKITEASDPTKHVQIIDIGVDVGAIVMGQNGDCLITAWKYFNANYNGKMIYYSRNLINWVSVIGDMPNGYTSDSIYARVFQPNSQGMVLSGIQSEFTQLMNLHELIPSVWLDEILEKNGFLNPFAAIQE